MGMATKVEQTEPQILEAAVVERMVQVLKQVVQA
jgi:hypothetical protein